MRYKNLTIIGTSHISKESIEEVKKAIEKKPAIIALELDRRRFYSLTKRKRKFSLSDIKKIGIQGFLFNLVGYYIEQKLGQKVGVRPGSEMIAAIEGAKKINAKIAFIDQDIILTLGKFSRVFGLKEKIRLFLDIFEAIFKPKKIPFSLEKVPSKRTIKALLQEIKERYPRIYNVLVEERNKIMAKNLYAIMKKNKNKKILAIVGAGHEEGIVEEIRKLFKQKIS